MKYYILFILIMTCIFSCQRDYNTHFSASDFLSNNDDLIIKVNAFNDFLNVDTSHPVFSKFNNASLKNLNSLLSHFKPKGEFLISLDSKNPKTIFSLITKQDSTLFELDSVLDKLSITMGKTGIEKTIIHKDTLYHTIKNGFFYGSNSLNKVDQISPSKTSNKIKSLLSTTDSNKTVSLLFRNTSDLAPNFFFNYKEDSLKISDYTILDFEFDNSTMRYNGITAADTTFVLNAFKGSEPQQLQMPQIVPLDTKSFMSISFDDFNQFDTQLKQLLHKPLDSTTTFLNYFNEVGFIQTDLGNFAALHALDGDFISEVLTLQAFEESFRDFDLYTFDDKQLLKSRFEPFFSLKEINYAVKIEDFLLFSENVMVLKSIISSKLNNQTLNKSEAFNSMYSNLSDASSVFIYKTGKTLSEMLGKDISDFDSNAVQLVYDSNFAHVNGIVKKQTKHRAARSVTEEYTVNIPDDIIVTPQTVKNHITGGHDIIVQDVNNVLYLISSEGKILWKKQLQGVILGAVAQIDTYKNGRLQLAFATSNRVYVLDRNGNDVGPFPLKFNDKITQPLSVFDYDNNRNYRLLVTQSQNLLMYSAQGKSISGFKYTKKGKITSQPKHYRIDRKDYIVFSTANKLNIINRQGATRINVPETIDFSENSIYLYQNKFTTTETSGRIVQVDTKGRLSFQSLGLKPNHKIDATSKTLVSFSDNRLSIKSRNIDLDFGDYTAPKLFYLNDKIYITVTDKQSKQVYLFDSQGKTIPDFPVYGVTVSVLEELDRANGLELITLGDNQTIIVYKLN